MYVHLHLIAWYHFNKVIYIENMAEENIANIVYGIKTYQINVSAQFKASFRS